MDRPKGQFTTNQEGHSIIEGEQARLYCTLPHFVSIHGLWTSKETVTGVKSEYFYLLELLRNEMGPF